MRPLWAPNVAGCLEGLKKTPFIHPLLTYRTIVVQYKAALVIMIPRRKNVSNLKIVTVESVTFFT